MDELDWRWQTRDGLQLYARGYVPPTPRAVVVLLHGHGDHSGRYPHVARAFAEAGYAFTSFDLRGHGLSDGLRGHVPSFEAVMDDVADFLEQVARRFPNLPRFLYGHSLGGNLAINFALRCQPDLAGMLVTGPWLRLAFDPPAAKITLGRMMEQISPTFTQPSGLDVTGLSRQRRVIADYIGDPLVHDRITARSFIVFYNAGFWAIEHAADLKLPTLLIHGEMDRLTSPAAAREFAEKAGAQVTLHVWPGLYHEIHNEPEQKEVIAVMLAWLETRLLYLKNR